MFMSFQNGLFDDLPMPKPAPSISSPEDFPAKMLQFLEIARDWMEKEPVFFGNCSALQNVSAQIGLSSKTYRAYSASTMGETSPPLFQGWKKSGMAWRGARLTVDIPVYLTPAKGCSLSEVLDPMPPADYFFTTSESAEYYLREKPQEVLSRCASDGKADYRSKGLGNASLRKLTPQEQERVMGFPEGWTNLDTEHCLMQ